MSFAHYDGGCYTPLQYSQYVCDSPVVVSRVIVHHTARPTVADWEKWGGGAHYLPVMRRLYEQRGWTCGPHAFCGPDGIWVMSPLGTPNRGAGWESVEDVNVEIVGNYMQEFPLWWTLDHAVACIVSLLRKSSRRFGALVKHCDFAKTQCPGDELVRRWDEFCLALLAAC